MTADVRGFRYQLASLVALEASRLQLAELKLAEATARWRAGQIALEQAREAVARFMGSLPCERMGESLDIVMKQLTTRYVGELQQSIRRMESRAAVLDTERSRALEAWTSCKQRVDQLDSHRDEARAAYAREQAASDARQADDDWIMRMPARGGAR